ncbi:unnamed protein product [Peronospora belbahrii]|nr:unnamed protein product [Peronospora belbahrii]
MDTNSTVSTATEYWQQHAALRAKHQGDVEKVHSAFKKYVDHMKGHDETEQKKKLRYLLSYVELCANILGEDKTTHQARKIEELDKVFKYIVKIVNPYLKKLRTETDKRSYPASDSNANTCGQHVTPPDSSGETSLIATTSSGSTMPENNANGFSSATTQLQPAGQTQQQSASTQHSVMAAQQKQQHYMMQQRAQQMQHQQQQMQAQAHQQQMIKQQQMMRQHQMQQKGPQQQAQFSAQQQSRQMKQQHNGPNAANQHSGQQTQQQLGQQGISRSQQESQNSVQQQKPPQSQQQTQHASSSRGESTSISSSLTLGLDDSLYGSMANDLLQMPTPSGTSSGGLMDFSNTLSPTSFGGMDLLDWDDGTSGQSTSVHNNTTTTTTTTGGSATGNGSGATGNGSGATTGNGGGGDTSDLMTFVETL